MRFNRPALPRGSLLLLALLCLLAYAAFELSLAALPQPSLERAANTSTLVLAEDGRILRSYLTADGKWRLKSTPQDLPDHYLRMLLAYEDKRFFEHGGVDPLASLRAAIQFLRHGRSMSGASTITMQTVRLAGERESGVIGKLRQAMLAIKLERAFDKQTILSAYLTLAPFGGNIEGARAAALQYYGKDLRALSIAEAAYLVALPQSPERRRPGSAGTAAKAGRDHVLQRLAQAKVLGAEESARAAAEPVPPARGRYATMARHLGDRLRAGAPAQRVFQTLIDYQLQRRLEILAKSVVARQADSANIALVVLRNSDMAVRAYIGGADYFDPSRAGMYDLVRGVRSPGSALKPFIYGLAFEDLVVHPQTIVTDDVLRINGYAPTNFDNLYRGDLSVREALVESVNTVAVMLLQAVGPDRFLGRLRSAGVRLEVPEAEKAPGLAIALGGLGISLDQLTALYASLANRGLLRSPRYTKEQAGTAHRFLNGAAAWAVADCLADALPASDAIGLRTRDGGRRVAFKTGTSYGFRDAWAAGFDSHHTVGVWMGRPDGSGRPGETGSAAAVPIMMQTFDLLAVPDHDVAAERPAGSILASQGKLPSRLQRYRRNVAVAAAEGSPPLQITFPLSDSTITLERAGADYSPFTVLAAGGEPPFRWLVDGREVGNGPGGDRLVWHPRAKGQIEFTVIDAKGRAAASSVWLD